MKSICPHCFRVVEFQGHEVKKETLSGNVVKGVTSATESIGKGIGGVITVVGGIGGLFGMKNQTQTTAKLIGGIAEYGGKGIGKLGEIASDALNTSIDYYYCPNCSEQTEPSKIEKQDSDYIDRILQELEGDEEEYAENIMEMIDKWNYTDSDGNTIYELRSKLSKEQTNKVETLIGIDNWQDDDSTVDFESLTLNEKALYTEAKQYLKNKEELMEKYNISPIEDMILEYKRNQSSIFSLFRDKTEEDKIIENANQYYSDLEDLKDGLREVISKVGVPTKKILQFKQHIEKKSMKYVSLQIMAEKEMEYFKTLKSEDFYNDEKLAEIDTKEDECESFMKEASDCNHNAFTSFCLVKSSIEALLFYLSSTLRTIDNPNNDNSSQTKKCIIDNAQNLEKCVNEDSSEFLSIMNRLYKHLKMAYIDEVVSSKDFIEQENMNSNLYEIDTEFFSLSLFIPMYKELSFDALIRILNKENRISITK